MAGTQDGGAEDTGVGELGELGGLVDAEQRLPGVVRVMIAVYLGDVGDDTQKRRTALAAMMLSESESIERLSLREIARRVGIDHKTLQRDWGEFKIRLNAGIVGVGLQRFEDLMKLVPGTAD